MKHSILKQSLCNYSDAYIHVKGTITISNTGTAAVVNNSISEINNAQVDNTKGTEVVRPMYNLREYSDISFASGSLQRCYRDEPVLNKTGCVLDFPVDDNNCVSFKFKEK